MEYRRFPPGESPVSTREFHRHRERAPHLEQAAHQERLQTALHLVRVAVDDLVRGEEPEEWVTVCDLGCGDGGLLSLVQQMNRVEAWGYDFQPSNAAGWAERGVQAHQLDVVDRWGEVRHADVYVATEVLEHLEEPEQLVRDVLERGALLVCSSPRTEHEGSLDACHSWAWDEEGYADLLRRAGGDVVEHRGVGMFQVCLVMPTVGDTP